MTDWKALARSLALLAGTVTPETTAAIKNAILGDGRVSKEEAEFLLDLKQSAESVCDEYRVFIHEFLKRVVLPDGEINATETSWLRKVLFADAEVDATEQRFLRDLKEAALVTCPEFDELCHQYGSI